jgi:hypothetical protein
MATAQRTIEAVFIKGQDNMEVRMGNFNSLSDRRDFLKKTVAGAGLAFAAPAILSSLGSGALQAQASGPAGAVAGRPYGSNDGRSM